MTHIINKFSADVIVSGLLRIINDKSLRNKYIAHLNSDFFCRNLEDKESVNIRLLVKTLRKLHDAGRDNQINLSVFADLIKQSLGDYKDLDAFIGFWNGWSSNPKIIQMSKEEPVFNVFIEYLKVMAVAKDVNPFSDDYQKGNIDRAASQLTGMLNTVRLIEGMALADSLSNMNIEDLILKEDRIDTRRFFYLGCQPIDDALGGFAEQTLNLIIGVTGGGKSATSHHILRTCVENGVHCYISVLEDRPESFIFKLVAGLTGIEINKLKKGANALSEDEKKAVRAANLGIKEFIKADFVYGQDVSTIHRLANDYDQLRMAAGKPLPFVNIVDYTGHIASKSSGDKGFEKMRNAYAERKDYALQNKKVCFDFAQVNREGSKRLNDEKILTQNDLAGAFDIAQVCDNILSINRNNFNKTDNTAQFHISKARDGQTGITVQVATEFHKARFNMKNFSVIQGPLDFVGQYNRT